MTSGRIVILTSTKVLESVEFKGEMEPQNLGAEIIQSYKDGKLTTEDDFIEFLRTFNEKNFGYSEDTLWTEQQLYGYRPEETLLKNADYNYIINYGIKGFIRPSCMPQTLCIYDNKTFKPIQMESYVSTEMQRYQKAHLKKVIVDAIALTNISRKEVSNLLTEIAEEYYK